jgi:hypothetical protein
MANSGIDELTAPRRRADYNEAERRFSCLLLARVQAVLEGRLDRLDLLRTYPGEPGRIAVMATPRDVDRDRLRLPVVEQLTRQAVEGICADAVGGPIAQAIEDGAVVETQTFSTRYPHIVVERVDRYADGSDAPSASTLRLRRVQNQRRQTQINRALDAANLLFEIVRVLR